MTDNGFEARLPMTARTVRLAAFAAAALTLGACGGGGAPTVSDDDPRGDWRGSGTSWSAPTRCCSATTTCAGRCRAGARR